MFNFYKMKKSKIFQLIIGFLAIYLCAVSIANIIIACDIDHIINCHDDDCIQCKMIQFCQIQMRYMYLFIPPIIITLILLNKQKNINFILDINKTKTLIDCKTQLNN